MQRRAAAIYVVFFLVVGTAAYSLIATAQQPTVSFENPDYRVTANESFDVGDRSYTVSAIEATIEGGEHGSPTTLARSGTLAWVNDSARYTETWDNNTTVAFQGTNYTVVIPNESDPSSLTLREDINETAILQGDDDVDDETVTRQGQEYVVRTDENGSVQLVPAGEYFPEPSTRTLDEGDTVDYNGNQTAVESIATESATLAWTAPKRTTVELDDRSNVTLNGQTYLAFFPNNETMVLTQDFRSYDEQTASIDRFEDHKRGLWGVTILSGAGVVFLTGLAFLPSRY